ncbi:hypothetical protein M2302_005866 [Micromonospora sp. A200]|uniref:hypothetical protein n=1 Tax=Micromonospora sp. A200 TaxID=2940568 RepID=UPI0024763D6D|nr:hypothetical protein [Micromonospora sp. A200]MDH6465664.1 hypothetical protein [Micromonospora sp. A200]
MRAWLQPAIIGLIVVSAFVGLYVGLQRNPEPHGVPLAVTGQQLATEVQQTLGDRVDVHQAADAASGRRAVLHRDAVAALGPDGAGGLRLDVAAANGLSTTNAVTGLAATYANQAGQHLQTADIVPLAKFDSRGLCGFYVAFGVTLAGFVIAQNTLGLGHVLALRHRFRLIWGFSAACGTLAAAIAGPILGALPAPFVPLAGTLALLAAAAAFTTKLLGTWLGPIGVPVATLLLLTIGNSTSGATTGVVLLPAPARLVSGLLPPGAAIRAVADLSYFGGAHVTGPLITLALWAVLGALLVGLRSRQVATRARQVATQG